MNGRTIRLISGILFITMLSVVLSGCGSKKESNKIESSSSELYSESEVLIESQIETETRGTEDTQSEESTQMQEETQVQEEPQGESEEESETDSTPQNQPQNESDSQKPTTTHPPSSSQNQNSSTQKPQSDKENEWKHGDPIISGGKQYNCIDGVYFKDNKASVSSEIASSMNEYYRHVEDAVLNKETSTTIALDIPRIKEGFQINGRLKETPNGWSVSTNSWFENMYSYANYKKVFEDTGVKVVWTIRQQMGLVPENQYVNITLEFKYYNSSCELIYATGKADYIKKVNEALNKGIKDFEVCVQIDSSYARPNQDGHMIAEDWYIKEFLCMKFTKDMSDSMAYPDFGEDIIMYPWDRADAVVTADYSTYTDITGLKIYTAKYNYQETSKGYSAKVEDIYDCTVLLRHSAIYLENYYVDVPVVTSIEEAKGVATEKVITEERGWAYLIRFDESISEEERWELLCKYYDAMYEVKNEETGKRPGSMKGEWQYRGYILFNINSFVKD